MAKVTGGAASKLSKMFSPLLPTHNLLMHATILTPRSGIICSSVHIHLNEIELACCSGFQSFDSIVSVSMLFHVYTKKWAFEDLRLFSGNVILIQWWCGVFMVEQQGCAQVDRTCLDCDQPEQEAGRARVLRRQGLYLPYLCAHHALQEVPEHTQPTASHVSAHTIPCKQSQTMHSPLPHMHIEMLFLHTIMKE